LQVVEGRRILIVHGHLFGVKSDHEKLAQLLRNGGYNLIIYGHSHMPEIIPLPQGYLMNPGSLSSPRRGSKRSYGIVEIGKGRLAPYIYELK